MLHLEPIGPKNWRTRLQVREDQQNLVADCTALLARAYAYRDSRSQAKLIYAVDTPVGMLLYYDWEPGKAFVFSQLLIDERYQRRGYGIEAARLALDEMKQDGRYKKVVLCYIEGNNAARIMYEKLGFVHNGEQDGDEIEMCLTL